MQLTVHFVGVEPHEQTPGVALYRINARKQATKVATLKDGKLDLGLDPAKLGPTVSIGPDVDDPKTIDPKLLVTLKLADQLPVWQKTGVIELSPAWWRPWLPIRICLSGTLNKCFPFIIDKIPLLRSIATGINPIPIRRCHPVCNGVVEVWQSTCCCFPFRIVDVKPFLVKLKAFLAAHPVMFPPVPDPGPLTPVSRVLAKSVDRAIAAGNVDYRFAPNTDIAQDLQSMQTLSAQDAVNYFQLHPSLWPIWCSCSSSKLGETALNPDGSFSYCYNRYLIFLPNCSRSYFYKVRQMVNGAWVYIYDGSAAHQYFNADQAANLSTFLGNACGTTPPPPGTDFVTLQQIGSTPAYDLHSNYAGVGSGNIDLTQTGPYSVAAPPALGGLVNFGSYNDAPWCKTLSFMLYFDPGMEALGAYYYRVSYAPADINGNPVGSMQAIDHPIAWKKFVTRVVGGITEIDIESQTLGPNAANLYQIPYNATAAPTTPTGSNQDWLSGQAHQYFDTTTLNPTAHSIPGPGNGRFLLAVEIFDVNGHRLIPAPLTPAAGSSDIAAGFQFLRLMSASGPGSTANVQQAALTHLFWADNRPVVAQIDSFSLNGTTSSEECQFLSGPSTASLQVGYRAYHAVRSDPNPPNPIPPRSFMSSFNLGWKRGLHGGSGTLDSGLDIDQPVNGAAGVPVESPGFPAPNGLLSNLLPATGPRTCSFAITLDVYSKHTNGASSGFGDLNGSDVAALTLSVT